MMNDKKTCTKDNPCPGNYSDWRHPDAVEVKSEDDDDYGTPINEKLWFYRCPHCGYGYCKNILHA